MSMFAHKSTIDTVLAAGIRLALLSAVLVAAGAACMTPDGAANDSLADVDDPAGKDDGVVRPLGSYADGDRLDGDGYFSPESMIVVLMNNHRYWIERGTGTSTTFEQGEYRYTKGGTTRYIRFTSWDGTTRMAYELDGDKLTLRTAGDGTEIQLGPVRPLCQDTSDCYKQGEVAPPEGWGCGTNICVGRDELLN